ncbi:MAG: hypothetical protein WAW31_12140 [Smithella sp.]
MKSPRHRLVPGKRWTRRSLENTPPKSVIPLLANVGFMMETLGLGDVETLRKAILRAPGFSPLDPAMPKHGKYNRRWGLLINAEIQP